MNRGDEVADDKRITIFLCLLSDDKRITIFPCLFLTKVNEQVRPRTFQRIIKNYKLDKF